jgi:hypothetical protein
MRVARGPNSFQISGSPGSIDAILLAKERKLSNVFQSLAVRKPDLDAGI